MQNQRVPSPHPWEGVEPDRWNDWHWQQASRVRTVDELERVLVLSDDERNACRAATAKFRMAVTPYYLSLIDPLDPIDPIRRQAIPTMAELSIDPSEQEDPLAEELHMPVRGLTHRYPDRVLLYTTHNCPVYCRFCLRKRKVADPTSMASRADLSGAIEYIGQHPEVRDVVLSGGDPLTFSDERLDDLLGALRQIEHVEVIRIATRNPVTLPQRITPDLCEVLRRHHPIYVNTHFNHYREGTGPAAVALNLLADAGCVLGNQMVLLAGVNDDPRVVGELNRWLLKNRTRPYYIHQCDAVVGLSHFRTPISAGVDLIESLRGWTSGLAVPHYVVDLPGGGGKVPMLPRYFEGRRGRELSFRSYDGRVYSYTEGTSVSGQPPEVDGNGRGVVDP